MLWVFEQTNQQTDRQTAGQTEFANFNIDVRKKTQKNWREILTQKIWLETESKNLAEDYF